MKNFITIILVLCLFGTITASAINDVAIDDNSEIEYLSDGSYIVTTLNVYVVEGQARNTSYQKVASKTKTNYDSNGNLIWKYTLTCTFTVDEGVSAVCTYAAYSTSINDNSWSFNNASTYWEGNVGYGKGLFQKKFLFVITQSVEIDISITCDAYGNIS